MILRQRHVNMFNNFRQKLFQNKLLKCSTHSMNTYTTMGERPLIPYNNNNGDFIRLELPTTHSSDPRILHLHQTWLRHHCRCSICYNHTTHQRQVKLNKEILDSKIQNVIFQNEHQLKCIWNDNHESNYELEWLNQNIPKFISDSKQVEYHTNNNNIYEFNSLQQIPLRHISSENPFNSSIDYDEFMTRRSVLKKLLKNIITKGYGIIINSPKTIEGTLKAIQRISHQQRTFYGDGPTITTSNLEYKDTAYTNEFLQLHTDTSYFSEPMGLQVFHLLYHYGSGGSNSISDGFYAAQLLYKENPYFYSILSSVPILYEYLDAGNHFYSHTDVILSHNLFTRNLERIRFNASDMGTLMDINPENLTGLYESIVRFSSILENEAKWITLTPGTIIFLDNWRILHGRNEFNGKRSMASAYIARSDWLSKAKVMDVI